MKISVVTISYNQAAFLERAINSVLSQTGVDVEYIMVDPGSADGSREIIERYLESFAVVIQEKDDGPADGLNKGFARATGDVYCYLNSDDTFEPGAFARAAAFLEKRPEYDVICGHAWVTDKEDRRLRRVWSEPYCPRFVAYGAAVQIQPSTFIRRAAFLKCGGFNPENRISWDGELLADLHLTGAKIGIIDEFLSCYRLHSASITVNHGKFAPVARESEQRHFEKLMGRPMGSTDRLAECPFRLAKHLLHPRATLERLLCGSIHSQVKA